MSSSTQPPEQPPAQAAAQSSQVQTHSVILFYKYAPLSDDETKMGLLRDALEALCTSLNLTGRILLGMSTDAEGINGTLAGRREDVVACTLALLGRAADAGSRPPDGVTNEAHQSILETFWQKSEEFARVASVPPLYLDTPEDFKWSTVQSSVPLFPDLNIKLVKEIIATGGKLSSVLLEDTRKGYLTPEEWHEEMKRLGESAKDDSNDDTILIDCRNHKEYEIGHFEGALDPNTKTFEQFPRWVSQNKAGLQGKNVLMCKCGCGNCYEGIMRCTKEIIHSPPPPFLFFSVSSLPDCTGGIRCEKASAFIRQETGAVSVRHLKGGIHKYLDQYGADGTFHGKNFVFDRRVGAEASSHVAEKNIAEDSTVQQPMETSDTVVGRCLYCKGPYDTFTPDRVCTVCREPTLVCDACRSGLCEFHCSDHEYLKSCYFTDLSMFSVDELRTQLQELEQHLERMAVGKRFKQKRKTINRQCDRVRGAITGISSGGGDNADEKGCRNCGNASCDGKCWGFHGLGRKKKLADEKTVLVGAKDAQTKRTRNRASANQRSSKILQRERDIKEIRALGLSAPPSTHRNAGTSLRCPPPCIRLLQSSVKGKWCGKTVQDVLRSEFKDLSDNEYTSQLMTKGLIQLNGVPVRCEAVGLDGDRTGVSASTVLKNMDVVSRVVDWHEPPVMVSESISVEKMEMPANVIDEYNLRDSSADDNASFAVFCCDKPATVPVHPAGPYLSNTLTMMVEGQEGLDPRSLRPCHRLDRCTSGLTICATSPAVARLMQGRMEGGAVKKLYVARVCGSFPSWEDSADGLSAIAIPPSAESSWTWGGNDANSAYVEVNAPVENIDPINGIRAVRDSGKPSRSRFRLIAYDESTNSSLVACYPVTGRGHQLRVHLQHIGFPISGDVQYGGIDAAGGTGSSGSLIDAAKQSVVDASKASSVSDTSTATSSSTDGVQEEQAKAAKEVCRCCNGREEGIISSFSSAQLLGGGHAIALHAYRYQVTFERKNSKKRQKLDKESTNTPTGDDDHSSTSTLAALEFSTNLPKWAQSCKTVDLSWL